MHMSKQNPTKVYIVRYIECSRISAINRTLCNTMLILSQPLAFEMYGRPFLFWAIPIYIESTTVLSDIYVYIYIIYTLSGKITLNILSLLNLVVCNIHPCMHCKGHVIIVIIIYNFLSCKPQKYQIYLMLLK